MHAQPFAARVEPWSEILSPPDLVRETRPSSTLSTHTHTPHWIFTFTGTMFAEIGTCTDCHFVLPAMPKVQNKNSRVVTAKDEPRGLIERISISKETRDRYKDVCKRRPAYKPKREVVKTHAADPEIMRQGDEDIARLGLLSRLLTEKRKLEDRISNPPPLIERLATPPPVFVPPPVVIPKDAFFKKEYINRRVQEVRPILEAVKERFDPWVMNLSFFEGVHYHTGIPGLSDEVLDKVWDTWKNFEDVYENFDKKPGHRWTNATWRGIIGACKRMGRVSVDWKEVSDIVDTCNKLAEMDLTFPPAK